MNVVPDDNQTKGKDRIMEIRGSIPQIIRNDENVYQGNLIHYFRAVFNHARNLGYPYHNFRHIFHVFWLCYQACLFYKGELSPKEMRNLLIAAMFHDFDHSGLMGDDDINILRAIRGLKRHLLEEDKPSLPEIIELIQTTEYPYKRSSAELGLSAQIIRDADLSQSLSVAWVQQVIFGLATEWNRKPIDVLKMQGPFMMGLKFSTKWGHKMFPKSEIVEKVKEVGEFLELLGETAPAMAKAA
jgi:3'5'-cyclic nucleotide phosphodiesterase